LFVILVTETDCCDCKDKIYSCDNIFAITSSVSGFAFGDMRIVMVLKLEHLRPVQNQQIRHGIQ
jgi:hypothetical protein